MDIDLAAETSVAKALSNHATPIWDFSSMEDGSRISFTTPEHQDKEGQSRREKKDDVRLAHSVQSPVLRGNRL